MWLADHWDIVSVGFVSDPSCSAPQALGAAGVQEGGGGKFPSAAIALAWALQGKALIDTSHGGECWILVLRRNFAVVLFVLSLFLFDLSNQFGLGIW